MKTKQLEKEVAQLTDEGVAQLFTLQQGNRKVIGTVGELQFEVIQYRLEHEYGASCGFTAKNFHKACWMTSERLIKIDDFIKRKVGNIGYDKIKSSVFSSIRFSTQQKIESDYPKLLFIRILNSN